MEEKKLQFRKLKPSEIELRVGQTNDSGFSLLLYKDARVDMNLLDEVVGPDKWQRKHYMLGNDIYCSVGIYYENIGWVWKDDAGASGSIEIEKSKASDSFKRACVNATGVGRELYTSPFVWITKDQNNDPKKSHYQVSEIDYKDNEISKLVIINEKTKQVVFSMGSTTKVSKNTQETPKKDILADATKGIADEFGEIAKPISKDDLAFLQAYVGNLGGNEYTQFFTWLKGKYGISNVVDLNEEQGKKLAYYLKNRNR